MPVSPPGGPEDGLRDHDVSPEPCNPSFRGGSEWRSLQGCSLLPGKIAQAEVRLQPGVREEPTICSWGNRHHQLSQVEQLGYDEVPGIPTAAASRPPYLFPVSNASTAVKQLPTVPPTGQQLRPWAILGHRATLTLSSLSLSLSQIFFSRVEFY